MSDDLKKFSELSASGKRWVVAITGGLLAISALDYWLIFARDGVSLQDKVSAVLALIGAYGISLGFFGKSESLGAAGKQMIENLTSPNADQCMIANLDFLVALLLMVGVAVDRHKSPPQSLPMFVLSTIVLLPMALVVFAYVFFHIFVVLPVTYPAVVIASAVVDAYEKATADATFAIVNKDNETAFRQSLKDFVLKDKAASKAYIMGLPAAALALASRVFTPFL